MTGGGAVGTPAGSLVPPVVPPGVDPEALDVVAVPAGWWVRMPGGGAPAPDDPAFAALPHPDAAVTVIVGAPGSPTPSAGDVAALLASLPDDLRDDVVVSIYGGGSESEPSLPQRLADLTERPVLVQHGLLRLGADGEPHVVAVDPDREPPWRPFAQHCLYRPGLPPKLERWGEPGPGLDGLGAGGYRLMDGWFVQVVPAGLVVCCTGRAVDPTAGTAPFDPVRLDLTIDHPVAELPDAVLAALGRLADALPAPTRSRLRVVLPYGTTDAEALRVRWAVPAPAHIRAVGGTAEAGEAAPGAATAGGGGPAAAGGDGPAAAPDVIGQDVRVEPPRAPATLLVVTARGGMRLAERRGGREREQDREAHAGTLE